MFFFLLHGDVAKVKTNASVRHRYFVGEYIKKTVLQYWQANEEMVNEIISTIPDTDESNQMRSNFLQHLGVEGK